MNLAKESFEDKKIILSKLYFPSKKDVDPEIILRNPRLQNLELERCRRDPWYFMTRWVYTKNEVGQVEERVKLFPSYKYLKVLIDNMYKYDLNLVPKSRRLTITWAVVAALVWECIFVPNSNIFMQSKKEEDAKELVRKAAHILRNLPGFVAVEKADYEVQTSTIVFANGSRLTGVPRGADIIRMHTATRIFFDEAAFNDEFAEAVKGAKPSIEGGGGLIAVSSIDTSDFLDAVNDIDDADEDSLKNLMDKPEHTETMFGLEEWDNKKNKFHVTQIHYNAHPYKDQRTEIGRRWKKEAMAGLKNRSWAQEYEISQKALEDGLVYGRFHPDDHIKWDMTIEDIPEDWPIYMTCDIGIDAPTACLWAAVDPDDNVYIIDEYYRSNLNIDENSIYIKEQEQKFKTEPVIRIIDPAAFKRTINTGTTPAAEYQNNDLDFIAGTNDVLTGIEVVRQYLTPVGKHPAVYFLPGLKFTFREIRKYKSKNGKPIKKNDHLMDCLKYLLVYGPKHGKAGFTKVKFVTDKRTGTKRFYAADDLDFPDDVDDRKERFRRWIM